MAIKERNVDQLENRIINSNNDINVFHISVQWIKKIQNQPKKWIPVGGDQKTSIDDKWKQISKTFGEMDYNPQKYSADKCRQKFFNWLELYAKNYDRLEGHLESGSQELFDLLKIVHILNINKLRKEFAAIKPLLKQIGDKDEVKDYLNDSVNKRCRQLLPKPKKSVYGSDLIVEKITISDLNLVTKKIPTNDRNSLNGDEEEEEEEEEGEEEEDKVVEDNDDEEVEEEPPLRPIENNGIQKPSYIDKIMNMSPDLHQLITKLKKIGILRQKNGRNSANTGNEIVTNFDNMNLKPEILNGIKACGWTKPSPIQQRAIVPCIQGRDIIAQAQSGMGKTAAFVIAVLQTINTSVFNCQAMIVTPTHELAQQIDAILTLFDKFISFKHHLCFGGRPVWDDVRSLKMNVHIVVGTIGRICDLINREALQLSRIKILVLDESDHLLDLKRWLSYQNNCGDGFNIYEIIKKLSPKTQLFLSSATIPVEILEMSEWFMRNPVRILVKNEELTLEGIQQFYVKIGIESNKLDAFCDLFKSLKKSKTLVYCNTRDKVDALDQEFIARRVYVPIIHGTMNQKQREDILRNFRHGANRILLTSDLLGRGIDVQQVSVVINYDLPKRKEDYIHRVGRSGRFGRNGIAISLVTDMEMRAIKKLQKFYNTQIKRLPENFLN